MGPSTYHWFGTDGIRAVAGEGPLTSDGVTRIGRALARFASARAEDGSARVLIAGDPRPSTGPIIEGLAGAMGAEGARVFEMGIVPTPALAWAMAEGGFDLGLMVSASHNPPEYNGIKPFIESGRKLTRAEEEEIEALLAEAGEAAEPTPPPRDVKARFRYIDATVDWLADAGRLDGMRLVVDLAAGAATTTVPDVLTRLGAEVELLHQAGEHVINLDCGTQHPESWLEALRGGSADAGLAFDGDADRVLIATAEGELLDGDDMLAILAHDAHENGGVPADKIVSTVMANLGLEERLADFDATLVRTAVGDRQVAEAMRESGAAFGGEPSGHVVTARTDIPGHATALIGDALVAGVRVLQAAKRLGKDLGTLRAARPRRPQLLVGVRVTEKTPIDEWPALLAEIERQEKALEGIGRLVIRYSGTEPLLRIMAEGREMEAVEAAVQAIQAVAEAGR
ncbi:MAG: phosphoglucosamine mutase [Planctomycetota bacterium]|nr:phosphoglucosamine mutase [Planctomycetota bacterium]